MYIITVTLVLYPAPFTLYTLRYLCGNCNCPLTVLSHVQCAGVNGDKYQGEFSEPVAITLEPPETQEGKTQYKQRCVKLHGLVIL